MFSDCYWAPDLLSTRLPALRIAFKSPKASRNTRTGIALEKRRRPGRRIRNPHGRNARIGVRRAREIARGCRYVEPFLHHTAALRHDQAEEKPCRLPHLPS